jgi:S-adenosylmethionine:tRNA ribosyltransferase-isomerase
VKTAEFDYELPPELIAQTPVEPRDASRLMVIDRQTGDITHHHFHDLPNHLRAGDLLVYNDSRVIPARLYARKPTGGQVEILLLRPRTEDTWEALVGGKRVRIGMQLTLLDGPAGRPTGTTAQVTETGEGGLRVLSFSQPALSVVDQVGTTPLPPYIHTPLENTARYQTIYAHAPGSAAAPTAGLHFTPEVFRQLRDMGVKSSFVTLHIGLGTFRPVSEATIEEHTMHTEYCVLTPDSAQEINEARLQGSRVIAVGTTSARVLESAAARAARGPAEASPCPWRPVTAFEGDTNLFITPGYRFRAVDALITNFHLPRSTLLMLVAAFAGKDLLDRAYAEAIRERYRFYSFGDAMLIL